MSSRVPVIALAAATALFGFSVATAQTSAPAPAAAPPPPKNLQVFPKDIPRAQLIQNMKFFAQSLGVRCTFCHVGQEGQPLSTYDFASDAKREKQTARAMLVMVHKINKDEFDTTKHSMNLNDCKVTPPTPASIQVCELATKNVITIKDNEFDASKHSKDLNDCKEEVPQVLAATGPETIALSLFGSSALGYGAFSYFQSRRHLINKLLGR